MTHSRSGAKGLARFLGSLEATVMEEIWALGSATVHEIRERLAERGRPLAYTTVLTVMQHLRDKKLLTACSQGRCHRFHPTETREAFLTKRIGTELSSLLTDFPETALMASGGDALSAEARRRLLALIGRLGDE